MSPALWFSLVVPAVYAEAPAPAEGRVVGVEVTGLKRVEEAALLDVVRLRPGDLLDSRRVQRDISAIWQTGYVDDVVVRSVPAPDGSGVIVRFEVREKPAVREVKLQGTKKIKDEDLKEAIDIEAFTVPSDARVAQNVKAIKDKYLEKGFFLAEVEPVFTAAGDDLVDLTFQITEHRKVVVQKIDITGNENVPDAKLKRFMQTKAGGILPWLTSSGTFIQENLENDTYILRSVYLEEGYVDAQVDQPKVFLSPDKRYIYVTIHVNEGPRYRLGKVAVQGDFVPEEGLTEGAVRALVEGKDLRDVQEAFERDKEAGQAIGPDWEPDVKRRALDFRPENTPLRTGDWFKLTTLQNTMQRITDLYGDQGYAFANATPVPQPDAEARVVDVLVDIQRGEKMKVGKIDIVGNDPTYDKVVRREIPIDEGETFRGSLLGASRQRLMRLGFFEDIKIATPPGEGKNVLDMNVQVAERPTGSFSLGLGYSNLESLVLNGSVSKNNFLGMGYNMSASVNWSKLRRQGSLSFFDPFFLDSRWIFSIDTYYLSQQFQAINNEYRRGGSVSLGRYLDTRNDVNLRLLYTFEDVGLQGVDPYRLRLFGGDLYRNGLTSSVGAVFSVDKRNDRIFPTRGILTNLRSTLAGGFRIDDDQVLSLFGGEFNFVESNFNFRMYQPIVPKTDRVVFRMNVTLGDIRSTDGREIAFIHRYRAGGINSLRGFNWYSLGPSLRVTASDDPVRADDKLIVGGTQTWTNNFEIESAIVPQAGISTVVFFDAGNAFGGPRGLDPLNPFQLRTSVGAGVRWRSPIGPLRFELGVPLRPQPGERRSVFDFGIGSFF